MNGNTVPPDLTLEIGGGHNPSPRADVVVDKYLFDNAERSGELKLDRPVVIADGEYLPFRDKVFAHTIGRQVMEHMNDLERFFSELTRVSSSGYLASPSCLRETMFWWKYHSWLFAIEDGVLICAPKTDQQPLAEGLFHYLAAHNRHFRKFLKSLPIHVLHAQYHWTDKIDYRIVERIEPPDLSDDEKILAFLNDTTGRTSTPALKQRLLRVLPAGAIRLLDRARNTLYYVRRNGIRRNIDIESLLACPLCKGEVVRRQHGYCCEACERCYPILQGIPVFLVEESTPIQN